MRVWTRSPGTATVASAPALAAAALLALALGAAGAARAETTAPDTAGQALIQWAYDTWTVPWVQVRGRSRALAPASHATLMALACETSRLERDRLVRHLSPEECEHRMAAIRADQDTALIFRLDLRVFDEPGSSELTRLGPRASAVLEDDRGRRWTSKDIRRGLVLGYVSGQKIERVYGYRPPWVRPGEQSLSDQYWPSGGRNLTAVEHWLRFPRRDPRSGERPLDAATRWVRIRLTWGGNEWVATWTFLPEAGRWP